ncbi:MAG TPA: glycoside hydrolase family 88 protein [Roseiflexaceae bacterium]|nr:glycoside hydrolase family 88 protein [Roseiflexaceae bacterium]
MPLLASPASSVDLQRALRCALETIDGNLAVFADRYPDDTTVRNIYRPRTRAGLAEGANVGWTTAFWPGMLWLAYELTGDETYRRAGERHVRSFSERVERGVDLETHDLGFLYTLSCVAPWRLTGNQPARRAALLAAEALMRRFLEPAGIFQAWGNLADPAQRGRTIIDSLMNMPLLYWASEQTADRSFAQAAHRHAIQLRDTMIRPDNTTYHTYHWDTETGAPRYGTTEQGRADDSCWARGQAWGIYGFALNYRSTGDESLLRAAGRCADHFLDRLPDDYVVYWDLALTGDSGEERDSSAAAIAVCGLLELALWLPENAGRRYRTAADAILASLAEHYAPRSPAESNALLLHSVYDKPKSVGVDEGSLWGDYFYLEALTRTLKPGWKLYW